MKRNELILPHYFSLCIYNVSEERFQHDKSIFNKVCDHLLGQSVPIDKIVRIGKKQDPEPVSDNEDGANESNNKKQPRLVKVCFGSAFDKRKFMSNLYKMKEISDNLKDIRVRHDLAPDDLALTKSLLKQAYDKNQAEKPKGFLYKVRGPPQAPKIVKIYHK